MTKQMTIVGIDSLRVKGNAYTFKGDNSVNIGLPPFLNGVCDIFVQIQRWKSLFEIYRVKRLPALTMLVYKHIF